jgi:hypothetical protein
MQNLVLKSSWHQADCDSPVPLVATSCPAQACTQLGASRGLWLALMVKPTLSCRACFSDLQRGYFLVWLALDYFSDVVYIADLVIRLRTGE